MWRWSAAAAAGSALLFASALASAQDVGSLALDWRAPANCPGEQDVTREIAALLDGRATERAPVRARARARRVSSKHWTTTVHVEKQGVQGRRTLEAESCQALTEAVALVIALAIDPGFSNDSLLPKETEPPPEPNTPTNPLTWSGVASLGGIVDTQSLPGVAGGLQAGLGVEYGGLLLGASGRYLFGRATTAADHPSARATIDLAAAALESCYFLSLSDWRLGPCAALELGRLRAESEGVTDPSAGRTLWLAVDAGVVARWRFRAPWGLSLGLSAIAPLQRPTFEITGISEPVYAVKPVSFRASLSIEAAWPRGKER